MMLSHHNPDYLWLSQNVFQSSLFGFSSCWNGMAWSLSWESIPHSQPLPIGLCYVGCFKIIAIFHQSLWQARLKYTRQWQLLKMFRHMLKIASILTRLSNLTFRSPKYIDVVLQPCATASLGRTNLQNRNARELWEWPKHHRSQRAKEPKKAL